MRVPLVIFHPMDPRGSKVGGAETFVRGLIRHAPADFDVELVGVSSAGRACGEEWLMEGSARFRFRPLVRVADESRRGLVPLSLRYAAALWPLRNQFRDRVLLFNRIEPLLPFCGMPGPKIAMLHNDVARQIAAGPGEVLWSRFPRLYFALERRCFRASDQVYAVSRATVEESRRRYPEYRERIDPFSTWFDLDLFSPGDRAAAKQTWAQRHSVLRPQDDWILYAGRFQPQKAPLRLIEAFGLVRRRRPGARLVLAGEGNLEAEMVRAVADRGLQGHVVFLGAVPPAELAACYRAADAFLLASDYEGMPISVLEALACGLPVVSTPVGEVPALVVSGVNGEMAADCSAAALAAALERLLARHPRPDPAACTASVRGFTPGVVLQPIYDRIRSLAVQRTPGAMR